MNTDDPIIAVIEAHRRAHAETCAAYERLSVVEAELVAGVRVSAGEAENDPRWIAANDAAGDALAVQDDLAVKLLETKPTKRPVKNELLESLLETGRSEASERASKQRLN